MHKALLDLGQTTRNYYLFLALGWQDVATRYRRSRVGAFWLTINTLVMIAALGLIFGSLFNMSMKDYLPSLAIGLILWGFIASMVNEGCTSFTSASDMVLQVKVPFLTHVFRVAWRNLCILGHNLLIIPFLFVILLKPLTWSALWAIPGMLLLTLNLLWMMIVAGVICTRFRDLTQMIQNAMQVLFYVTPIIWSVDMVKGRVGDWVQINPFYHLLSIVREPLLGNDPTHLNWLVAIGLALIGWILALLFFNRFYKRIPYWL